MNLVNEILRRSWKCFWKEWYTNIRWIIGGRKQVCSNLDTVSVLVWRDRGKPRDTSTRIQVVLRDVFPTRIQRPGLNMRSVHFCISWDWSSRMWIWDYISNVFVSDITTQMWGRLISSYLSSNACAAALFNHSILHPSVKQGELQTENYVVRGNRSRFIVSWHF